MRQPDRTVNNTARGLPLSGRVPKAVTGCFRTPGKPLVGLSLLLLTVPVFAADDIDELRRQLREQQALIAEQRANLQAQQQKLEAQNRQLDRQQQQLDQLAQRLNSLLPDGTGSAVAEARPPLCRASGGDDPRFSVWQNHVVGR